MMTRTLNLHFVMMLITRVDEGVIYPDVINAVKSALTHHSITTDYHFQAMKKYKSRFRAKVDIGLSFQS
jgi:hypothetical protein